MRKRFLMAVVWLAIAGCVAHEKAGDSAAATGDWKTAYSHYREALNENASTPGLREKFDQAKREALSQSWAKAQGCATQGDWGCALAESDFILSADPGNAGAQGLKAQAAAREAMGQLDQARVQASQLHYKEARDLVARARQLSKDPQVTSQAAAVEHEIAVAAAQEGERRRADHNYDGALEMYKLAADIDANYRGPLRQVEAEREQYVTYLYEQSAVKGDQLLAQNDFRGAAEMYREALKVKPGGRAETLARYADALVKADEGMQRRDWASMEAALKEAIATGQDRNQMAAGMLEKVKIRPYRVSVRSLLLNPTRPDGNPWAGTASAALFKVAQMVSQALQRAQTDVAENMADLLPPTNCPDVRIQLELPDGMVLSTESKSGIHSRFDGEVIVSGNAFDERQITFRAIKGNDPNGEVLGHVTATLKELFSTRTSAYNSDTIVQLVVSSDAADGRTAGTYTGLKLLQAATAVATTGTTVPATGPGTGTTPVTTPVTGTGSGTTSTAGGVPPGHGGVPPGHGGVPPGHGAPPVGGTTPATSPWGNHPATPVKVPPPPGVSNPAAPGTMIQKGGQPPATGTTPATGAAPAGKVQAPATGSTAAPATTAPAPGTAPAVAPAGANKADEGDEDEGPGPGKARKHHGKGKGHNKE